MKSRLIMVGPPGAGKGTQAKVLCERIGIPAISTGAIFRKNIAEETELGLLAQGYISEGNLVPDDVTNRLVEARLREDDAQEGFLLDGYPRNLDQVAALDAMLEEMGEKINCVVELTIPDDIIVDRLLGRAALEGREDDTEEVIRHRINVYHESTQPLVSVYRERGILLSVDGVGTIDEVLERLVAQLRAFLGL